MVHLPISSTGTVTVMEDGFAANTFKHSIRSSDISGPSISIIIRQMTPEALFDLAKRKAEVEAVEAAWEMMEDV